MKRYAPKIPGACALVVFNGSSHDRSPGEGRRRAWQRGPWSPDADFPTMPAGDYLRLLPGALAIVAISCAKAAVVRSYSNKYGYKADGDQMLFVRVANLAAGFTGPCHGQQPVPLGGDDAAARAASCPAWWPGRDHHPGDAFFTTFGYLPMRPGRMSPNAVLC